jgi:hypothetical protein
MIPVPRIHTTGSAGPPNLQDQWRAIILFGRNVASYKFALAQSLLELRPQGGSLVSVEALAKPFALNVCKHLKIEDKQSTSASSSFLDGCRKFNRGELSEDQLVSLAAAKGFANVVDAFHVVGGGETPQRFFLDERSSHGGLRITDDFSVMIERNVLADMPKEVEARWRLVETAWRLRLGRSMLVTHDTDSGSILMLDRNKRRTTVTSSRDALNGYQQGRCFYCSAEISLTDQMLLADVDHFFPHVLKTTAIGSVVDGVWNLVLACKRCNRGTGGKMDRLPSEALLQRLHGRNEFLIGSHHPLRETLIMQTGADEPARRQYLRDTYALALGHLIHRWVPRH